MVKRKWYWVLAAFVFLCIGSFVLFKPKAPLEPITIYRATPAPKSSQQQTDTETETVSRHPREHTYGHDHSSHAHTVETFPSIDTYDWRNDNAFDAPQAKTDPWKQTYASDAEKPDDADLEIYPPPDWYKTEDPVLRAEYYGAQMLKQFGDIPEVHTVSDWERKKAMGRILTHEELIIYLEALYHLFPREGTLNTLNYHRELRAKGVEVKMIPEGDTR